MDLQNLDVIKTKLLPDFKRQLFATVKLRSTPLSKFKFLYRRMMQHFFSELVVVFF
jgi:hypothetical protein